MTGRVPRRGEDRLIDWLRRRGGGVGLIGDDAALLPPAGPLAVTVDHQIAGVHFPDWLSPADCARRLLAVNLSDLAAVGAEPRWAFLALAAPPEYDRRAFLAALLEACGEAGAELAGGDLARAGQPSLSLTLLGQRPEGGAWLTRSAARPGDRLWVGGRLGAAAAGLHLLAAGARLEGGRVVLPEGFREPARQARAARRAVRRQLRPTAQIELGTALGRRPRAAAIDLSDGLAVDLHRLCRESGVGAAVEAEALPLGEGLVRLAEALDADPLELALHGGEDYVLLFALPDGEVPEVHGCTPIGRITARRAVRLTSGREERELPPAGWDHLDRSDAD